MIRGKLTAKEMEALALIAQGHDAKSAGRELNLSAHTIYERLRRAKGKLGTSSSREAARLFFGAESQTNENSVYQNLVLSDVAITRAFPLLPDPRAVDEDSTDLNEAAIYQASSFRFEPASFLPLRGDGEREIHVGKVDRLRLISELSLKMAMAFVAVCLSAMVLSNLLQRG